LLVSLMVLSRAFAQAPVSKGSEEPKTSPHTMQILSSYEGQTVNSIELAGRPGVDTERYAQSLTLRASEPFSKQKIDETIAALKRDGKFEEVQLEVEPEGNGIRVLLVLQPAIYFGMFQFPGAERFSYSRLVQVSNYPPQAPFNRGEIQRDSDNLLNFFRQQGFFQAQVSPEVKLDTAHGLANICFNTRLNKRSKFGNAVIAGTTPQQAESLADNLRGLRARMRGAAIRPGKTYRYGNVARANKYLQSRLEKQDRLAAKVQPHGAEYHPDTNRADIHFNVDTGPEVLVDVKGAHLWSWTRRSLLPVYQGAGVDPELVEEGREALTSYFQAKGFFDVKVTSQFNQAGPVDTIVYEITKGKKHKVKAVEVAGNKNIKTDDLMNQVKVQKGGVFSRGKFSDKVVRTSSKNLEALYKSEGYSSARVTPHVENNGGDIRVRFTVDEGPQDVVQSLKIEGAETFPQSHFAPSGLKLGEGKAYSQRLVESDRANIVAHYLQVGYLTASFRETAHAVSKNDPHHLNVVYHIYEGPQVYTGNVITLGREKTQERLINEDTATIEP
jgi:outer membrane protein insertion porin family